MRRIVLLYVEPSVRPDRTVTIGRPSIVARARRDEGAERDSVTEEQRCPGAKGPPRRTETLLGSTCVARRFHTPGMRAPLSLTHYQHRLGQLGLFCQDELSTKQERRW